MADSKKIGVMQKAAGNGKLRPLAGPCSLCGSRGHNASIHGREAAIHGPATKENRATQFSSSRDWAAGGDSNKHTTGSPSFKFPAEDSEGGMS